MTTSEARPSGWGFQDLALMLGAILPALLAGVVMTRVGKAVAPGLFENRAAETLAYQTVFYALMLGALYFVVVIKGGNEFWTSLGWTLGFRGAWSCAVTGPALMIAISLLGEALRTPIIPNPWEGLITGKASQVAVLLYAAVIGPVWEELMFRGFLYPLLERFAGPWLSILGCAALFGLIHGAQNEWQWQYVVLVAVAGIAFGFVRYRTGSTAASALMHSAYNSSLFIVFLIQRM